MPLDDTNWSRTETETKPNAFSLESLIAWLETQPPEKTYCWADPGSCLIHHFGAEHGVGTLGTSGLFNKTLARFGGPWPDTEIAQGYPKTYGAALSRARALLASRSIDPYLAETRK